MNSSVPTRALTPQEVVLGVAVPHWPLPMSLQVNPAAKEAVQRHHWWLCEHGLADAGDLADPLIGLDAARIVACAYPRADLDTLCLASDWTGWYLHFDDYFDETPLGGSATLARGTVDFLYETAGQPSRPPPAGYAGSLQRTRGAFRDLMTRTREVMAPVQYRIFTSHLEDYFGALVAEASNRERQAVLDIDDYCALRRDTGPCLPLVDLIEQAESVRLPQAFYASPVFEQLINTTADIASWINDVFSAAKEQERGDIHNLVLVTQRATGASLTEAARLAIARISDHLDLLDSAQQDLARQRAAGTLAPTAHDAIERWISGLRAFLHHGDWYLGHPRYDHRDGAR
jgi:hypothetical protein